MKHKLILLIIPILLTILGCSEEKWFVPTEKNILISHALGGINSTVYTNSKDAFILNYDKGYRWFEVDITLLKDGNLVCFHEGHEKHLGIGNRKITDLTIKEFESLKYDGKYQQISFKTFLEIANQKKGIYIVTDTKLWNTEIMDKFIKEVNAVDSDLFKKIIPQIYKEEDMNLIEKVDKNHTRFASLIFTLYAMDSKKIPNENILAAVKKYGIPIVTMPRWDYIRLTKEFIKQLHDEHIYTFTHTINNSKDAGKMYEMGIDGLYTDFYMEQKDSGNRKK